MTLAIRQAVPALLISALASALVVAGAPPARAQEGVDVSVAVGPEVDTDSFRPALSPYGQWVEVPGYGTVWRPNPGVVGADFTPYATNGHWVYTDAGWTWVSNYDWGWAPFHYGNWVYADDYWAWVPGRVWAPAWVEWRYGGGYVGWAPMGYRGYHPRFAYVEVNHFTSVNIHENVIVGARAETIAVRTQPMRSAQVVNGHPVAPVSAGPRPTEIAQATGHPVTAVAVHTVGRATPPASVQGVHYAAGTSREHVVAVQKLPPETARNFAPAREAAPATKTAAPRSVAATTPTHSEERAAPPREAPAPQAAHEQAAPHTEPLHEAPQASHPQEMHQAAPATRPAPPPQHVKSAPKHAPAPAGHEGGGHEGGGHK